MAVVVSFVTRAGQHVMAAALALPQRLVSFHHIGRQVYLTAGSEPAPHPPALTAHDPLVPLVVWGPLRHHRMVTIRARLLALKHLALQAAP